MAKQVQTRIDVERLEELTALVPRVQEAFPEIAITRAAVFRMVLRRGIDDLTRDIEKGRIR